MHLYPLTAPLQVFIVVLIRQKKKLEFRQRKITEVSVLKPFIANSSPTLLSLQGSEWLSFQSYFTTKLKIVILSL